MSQLGGEEISYLQNVANLMQAQEAANKPTGVDDIDGALPLLTSLRSIY